MSFFLIRKKKIEHQFTLDDIVIHIQQKPIKSIRLKIYKTDGRVCVSAPLNMNIHLIQKQIEAKREWIHTQRAHLQKKSAPLLTIESGEWHEFQGQRFELSIHETKTKPYIHIRDLSMQLYIHKDASMLERKRTLDLWYRTQMDVVLSTLIQKWQPIIGVEVSSYKIKQMKSRWGSCHPIERRISMNLQLIKKQPGCLEYVLVHEMIHILEPSHNKRFYALMQHFLPDWQTYKTMLVGSIE